MDQLMEMVGHGLRVTLYDVDPDVAVDGHATCSCGKLTTQAIGCGDVFKPVCDDPMHMRSAWLVVVHKAHEQLVETILLEWVGDPTHPDHEPQYA